MASFTLMKERLLKVLKAYGVLLLAYALHLSLVYVNYCALKFSFLMLNYDCTPFGEDLVFGGMWEALGLYEVTLADLFAAILALIIGFGTKALFNEGYTAYRISLDRRDYVAANDHASVALADNELRKRIVFFTILFIPVLVAILWDLYLFRFRFTCWVLNLEGETIASTLKDWPYVLEQYGHLFSIRIIQMGAYGYIAAIVMISLLVEKKAESKDQALVAFREAFNLWFEEVTGGGSAPEEIQTGTNQEIPREEAGSTNQVPAEALGTFRAPGEHPVVPDQPVASETPPQAASVVPWPKKVEPEPIYTEGAESETADDWAMVYGGNPGERVGFKEAAADPDSYYIDEFRRVWRRNPSYTENEPTAKAA